MGFYEEKILPVWLNAVMKNKEMTKIRKRWIPEVTGRVIEVGIGGGLNLPFYQKGVHVVGVDPSAKLREYAQEEAEKNDVELEHVLQSGETLPFENDSFDSAVVTWAFCTIPNAESAAEEIRRVLKPNGRLLFLEHGKSTELNIQKWQDRINPIWKKIGGGCNLNRRPDLMLEQQGFNITTLEQGYIPGPKFATYNYQGFATPA